MDAAQMGVTRPHGKSPSVEGIAVLGRSFEVLASFDPGGVQPLSLVQIVRRVGLPKTTVHRLLSALTAIGAVERAGSGYRLGMLLFELGERVPRRTDLREAALPFLQDLFEVTHETVHLAVLDRTEVLYLERIHGHRRLPRLASRVGGRQPAYCTGLGKALLAFTPEAAREVLSNAAPERRTPYTIVNPKMLAEELARVYSCRLATDRDENTIGIHCVATPVFVDGRAVAAISVTGPGERINEERIGSAVRTAALGLQRVLTAGPSVSLRP